LFLRRVLRPPSAGVTVFYFGKGSGGREDGFVIIEPAEEKKQGFPKEPLKNCKHTKA